MKNYCIFTKGWTIDTLSFLLHVSINDSLGLVGSGLCWEGKTHICIMLILKLRCHFVQNSNRLSSTGRASKKYMGLVAKQSVDKAIDSDWVNSWYNDWAVFTRSWDLIRCLSLEPANPFEICWLEANIKEACDIIAKIVLESLDCHSRVKILDVVLLNAIYSTN